MAETIISPITDQSSIPEMVGATGVSNGEVGGVPGAPAGQQTRVLRADGSWITMDSGAWTWRAAWADATSYSVDDLVSSDGSSYICTSGHTSSSSSEPGVGVSWTTNWDLVAGSGGVTPPGDATYTEKTRRKLNPSYDSELSYIPRAERKEWDAVGLMGKLRVKVGEEINSNWILIREISSFVHEYLVIR